MSETSPSTSSGAAYWGGPTDSASAYKIRQAKIVASSKSTADKGKSLRAMKKEASARGEKWTPGIPEVIVPESRDATASPRAPGAVYGGIDEDSAYKKRQNKILASKAATAEKGKALRASCKEASAKGEAWTPGRSMDALDMPEVEELKIEPTGDPNKKPGSVYGGLADDSAYKIRKAKILASDKPTANKAETLRAAKAEAAAKGEKWVPPVAGDPDAKPGSVYAGLADDSAYKLRQAKILASDKPTARKGKALRTSCKEASARGESWTPGRSMDALDQHEGEDSFL